MHVSMGMCNGGCCIANVAHCELRRCNVDDYRLLSCKQLPVLNRIPQAVSCLAVLPHSCRDSGLAEGDAIHVVGSLPSLGAWKQEQAPRMTRLAASHWQLEVLT